MGIDCFNCKYGDNEINEEPCRSCLAKDTPPYWRFVDMNQSEESGTQISLFDLKTPF